MAYIGRQTTQGDFVKLDSIKSQFNGVTKTFDLKSGGKAFSPGSEGALLVSLAGIIQESGISYTIDNNTITFINAPVSGTDVFMQAMGSRVNIGSLASGTVDASKLSSNFGTYNGTISATAFSGDGSSLTGVARTDNIRTDTDATFLKNIDVSGNVSIGGTLTYEDVTNVDSVGLITARSGIVVGSGITLSTDGNAFHTGIVTATSVNTTGSVTTSGGVDFTGLLKENVNLTAGKLSDNTNIDLANGMVHHFTTQETTTSTPNIRFDSSTTLGSKMSVGDSISVTLITTAAAAGYSEHVTIDGSPITENWVGGSAPTGGGSSGVDVYSYTILKTASTNYVVIANLSKTS